MDCRFVVSLIIFALLVDGEAAVRGVAARFVQQSISLQKADRTARCDAGTAGVWQWDRCECSRCVHHRWCREGILLRTVCPAGSARACLGANWTVAWCCFGLIEWNENLRPPELRTHPCFLRCWQAPLSRLEEGQVLNERYEAMEDRLAVRAAILQYYACVLLGFAEAQLLRLTALSLFCQVVRKRLNRPLNFAEKVPTCLVQCATLGS